VRRLLVVSLGATLFLAGAGLPDTIQIGASQFNNVIPALLLFLPLSSSQWFFTRFFGTYFGVPGHAT
jgi:hypothetical protein